MSANISNLSYSYEIFIGVSPDHVWRGLTDGELTRQYVYGTRFESRLRKGDPYVYLGDGAVKVVEGQILEIETGKRLAMTWSAHWDESTKNDRPSRVVYDLAPAGRNATKLRVVHDDFDAETATYQGSVAGWPLMLSSLKTLLESGRPLVIPVGE